MNKLLKPDEVAEFLGVQKSTIYQWTHKGFIPYVKLGRLVRFSPKAIEQWIKKKSENGRVSRRVEIDIT